jgi:hypothetical protein
MTVCIAAICKENDHEYIVMATDRMIDVGIGQFEHDVKKYKIISQNTAAMLAGSSVLFSDLVSNLPKDKGFTDLKKEIFKKFTDIRNDLIQKNLLDILNLTRQDIKNGILAGTLINNPVTGKLVDQMIKFKLNTGILLVGFENKSARVSEITEQGFADFDYIHSHSIGTGQTQAMNTLLFQKQSKRDNLKQTIYNVYKAKRNAEVSSGVGNDTDMLVLTEDGNHELTREDLRILDKIYKEELDFGRNSEDLNNLEILGKMVVKQVVPSR